MDPSDSRKPSADRGDPSPAAAPRDHCYFCGLKSTLPGVFRKTHRSFDSKKYWICPSCQAKEVSWTRRLGIYSWLMIVCFGLVALAFPSNGYFYIWCLNFAFLYVCMFASIIPHEFGHALAARCLGLRLFQIMIGDGRTWLRRRIRGIDIELKSNPSVGMVIAAHPEMRGYRWKQFLFILAGPIANGALLVLALAALHSQKSASSYSRWWLNDGFEGWLAVAEAWRGDHAAAAQHREQAHRAEPACYLLSRADAAIRGDDLRPNAGNLAAQNQRESSEAV